MKIVSELLDLLFPRRCAVCGSRLLTEEKAVCAACTFGLPYTGFRGALSNPVERMFWGKFPLGRASAYMFDRRDTDSRNVVFWLEYHGHSEIGIEMGRRMAAELAGTDFLRRHGQRDSARTALAAQDTPPRLQPKPHAGAGNKCRDGHSRQHETAAPHGGQPFANPPHTHGRRIDNVTGIFRAAAVERIRRQAHTAWWDDVVTTGATLTARADELTARRGRTHKCAGAGRNGAILQRCEPDGATRATADTRRRWCNALRRDCIPHFVCIFGTRRQTDMRTNGPLVSWRGPGGFSGGEK